MDIESSNSIQQILGFIDTKLEVLNLQGNALEEKGCFNVLRGLDVNRTLKKLNLADNKAIDDVYFVHQIQTVLKSIIIENNFEMHNKVV